MSGRSSIIYFAGASRRRMSRVRTALGLGLALCLVFIFSCVETKEDVIKNPPPAQKKPSPPPTSTHPAPVNNGNHSNVNHPNGASGKGVWHTVEPGQTLWRICKAYGVDMEQVARANGIHDPTAISTGQKIFIPGATRLMGVDPYQPPAGTTVDQPKPQPPVIEKPEEPDVFEPETGTYTSGKLLWPLPEGVGIIFSPFGTRKNYFHEGVDLSAKPGTDIYAADDGKVVYCDNTIRGYGNMIVIKHAGNLSTVYAHCRTVFVKEGDFVKRGDKIAEVGQTGKATGPHLHFEVRAGKEAVDPLKYMEKVKK